MAVKGLSRKKSIREVLQGKEAARGRKLTQVDEEGEKENKTFQQAIVDLGLLPKGRFSDPFPRIGASRPWT